MNYQRIHDAIIADSRASSPIGYKHRNTGDNYKEHHHIIPRCMGGTNDSENLIYLTARRHFIIHMLLTKIYPDSDNIKYAFHMMFAAKISRKNDIGWRRSASRNFEYFKKQMSVAMSNIMKGNTNRLGKSLSEETKKKIPNRPTGKLHTSAAKAKMSISLIGNTRWLGKTHSEETKIKMSNIKKGHRHSEETKIKMSIAAKNRNRLII